MILIGHEHLNINLISSTNKTDGHNITEIEFKVQLNTITP